MKIQDAFNILGIPSGNTNPTEIKAAYRKAAKKYHPDRNPAGLEMMQMINAAYEAIKDFSGEVFAKDNNVKYGDDINSALNAIAGLGLTIEVCGAWIWVSGNTKPHKDTLKDAGFMWASQKTQWYFKPKNYRPRKHVPWSMNDIRDKYGSHNIKDEQKQLTTH